MNVFERYAPFIQDYIYRSGWQCLRAVQNAAEEAIFGTEENVLLTASRPYYIQFTMEVSAAEFFQIVCKKAQSLQNPLALLYPKEVPVFEKYDAYVPPPLVRKGFAQGVLDAAGMKERLLTWEKYG